MKDDIGHKIIKILGEHSLKFESIDKRFEKIDYRFEKIDEKFEKIDSRFEKIDSRFEKIDSRFKKMDSRFKKMDSRFEKIYSTNNRLEREFKKLIHKSNENHEQTRNDIGALMEFMTDRTQLIIEGFKSEADRIEREFNKKHDNHETRITTLEKVS